MARFDELQCYTRGEQRRCTPYSAIASWLEDTGWVLEGEKAPVAKPEPLPEIPVEAGVDAFDVEPEEAGLPGYVKFEESLDEMTKAELLEWAMDRGHDLPNNDRKAEILKACKEIEAAE